MHASPSKAHGRPPPSGARAFLLGVLAVGLTNAFAEVIVYGLLIVPRLSEPGRVPLGAMALMYLPVLAACLWLGARAVTVRDALWMGAGASVIAQLEKAALAWLGAPGHETSLALIDPTRFWTLHFLRMGFGLYVLILVAHALFAWRSRRLAPGR